MIVKSKRLHLMVEFPRFDLPIIYNEIGVSIPTIGATSPLPLFVDPEIGLENLVESKHRQLARSHRTGFMDRTLKPNSKIRDELQTILGYPPTRSLNISEKDLVWNYRFYLSKDKKAVTKFVKSVTWTDPLEAKQAMELLNSWAVPDVDDALELLGPEFEHRGVRVYAVKHLDKSDDEELSLYLLQLVQALKFENVQHSEALLGPTLTEFLIARAVANARLGCLLYW
jgi:phosphatidylinositol 3-kinase